MSDRIGIFSKRLYGIPHLKALLGGIPVRMSRFGPGPSGLSAVAGWGHKPTADRARAFATSAGLPYLGLEDGFLRSFGLGHESPPFSVVVDDLGIYYDASRPSRLEVLIASSPYPSLQAEAEEAMDAVRSHGLSKYNRFQTPPSGWLGPSGGRVLVVDQTLNDMSVSLGFADQAAFDRMLTTALSENPEAEIIVKTHPDVVAGKKKGYLTGLVERDRVRVVSADLSPARLIDEVRKVYVVSSQLGFEALMRGKRVACFGVPWYSGWGLTEDLSPHMTRVSGRRAGPKTLTDLFASAYLAYARYICPETGRRGTIADVVRYLLRQRRLMEENRADYYCFGFSRWKRPNVRPFLQTPHNRVIFARDARGARKKGIGPDSCIVAWGHNETPDVRALSGELGIPIWRLEDGFIRSVGLGSDLIPPRSLVLDRKGIYYDPGVESDLEHILNTVDFSPELVSRASALRQRILANRITKYNNEVFKTPAAKPAPGQPVVLVPGQVENDASIRLGAGRIRTNLGLLEAVRAERPDAYILYKPHPDVLARNRPGGLEGGSARGLCDHMEASTSIIDCLEISSEVHTISSLSGFDALVRGIPVITYGRPFYAGWGLTTDTEACPRRTRKLTLDELVAGALLLYPRYWDSHTRGFVECETIIDRLVAEREALRVRYGNRAFRIGYLRRQLRKLALFAANNLRA